jgi:ABC-2 type transport system permease protein
MRILDLALKDLSQILREKRALLFLIVMPALFTIFMGFAYHSSNGDKNTDQRIALGLVNPEPDARLNKMLAARLESSATVKTARMSEADAMEALQKGEIAGVLVIPAKFSEQAENGLNPQLKLIADTTSTQGQSLFQLLRLPISQLMSTVEIARLSAEAQKNPAELDAAIGHAWVKWEAASQQSLVRLEQAMPKKPSDPYGGNPYNQSSPGILVQFAVFGLVTSAQIMVEERKTRTLQRLMTTAMKPWEIVAGHLLAMFAITFLQTALLVAFGQWVLKVDYLRQPLGTLLVAVAMGLWVASLGLLIGVLAKEEQQVVLFSLMAMFVFSALGGTWFPLEGAGAAFSAIGRLTPAAWAMNGFQNILIRGLGLNTLWTPVAILAAYALAFFLLAVWRFRKAV